jgi:hypothetical protein
MKVAKGSIRTLLEWRRCTVENGVHICLVTLAGVLHGRRQLENIRGKRRQNEYLITIFLVVLPYLETLFNI